MCGCASCGLYGKTFLFCCFVVIVFVATVCDVRQKDAGMEDRRATPSNSRPSRSLWLSFSMYTNGKKLFNMDAGRRQHLPALNGLRVISLVWIIIGQTLAYSLVTMPNTKNFINESTGWYITFVRQGVFAIDTFFFLSGFLLAYVFFNKRKNVGQTPWHQFYLHRFWRLTPAYLLILVLGYSGLLSYLSQGPFWSKAVKEAAKCKEYWWTNVLYINNFMSRDQQCFTSWYMATDMQLFLLSPFLLVPFIRSGGRTVIICIFVALGSCALSGYIAVNKNYSLSPDFTATEDPPGSEKFKEFINILFSKPYIRITPYIVGLSAGWFIHRSLSITTGISKVLVVIGWMASLTTMGAIIFVVKHPISDNHLFKTVYHAFARLGWSLSIAWIVVACCTGYGGIINHFLSLRIWNPLSRLSYCAFLSLLGIVFLTSLRDEILIHYSLSSLNYLALANTVLCFTAAIFLSLMFEAPFREMESLLFRKTTITVKRIL